MNDWLKEKDIEEPFAWFVSISMIVLIIALSMWAYPQWVQYNEITKAETQITIEKMKTTEKERNE